MKILFAGMGSIGQRHARNLRAMLGDDVDLLAYRVRRLRRVITPDMRLEPEGDVEARYGLRVFTDLDDALAERPDAVLVANPPARHMDVALAAARAGCALFIEKPLSHDWSGVPELIDLVERQGLVCMVGYQLRFHPGLRVVQALLRNRAIGAIVAARLEFGEHLPDWHPYEDYRETHMAHASAGGGVVLSQIHDLDYAYSLFGLPRRVYAVGGRLGRLEMDAEDTMGVLMECAVDGRSIPVSLHQDCLQRPKRRRCELVGEGRIELDFDAPSVNVFDETGRLTERHAFDGFERNQMYLDEMHHFLACLQGERHPVVGVREGADSLRMALAIKASQASGVAVSVGVTRR